MSEWPTVRKKYVVMAAVLGIVGIAGTGLVVWSPWSSPQTSARPCVKPDEVDVYFTSDNQMNQAVGQVRAEHPDATVTGQTQQQTFEEYKRMFADQPDVLKLARPDGLPAVVKVVPNPGVPAGPVGDALSKQFPPPAKIERLICSELQSAVPTH